MADHYEKREEEEEEDEIGEQVFRSSKYMDSSPSY